MPVIAAGRFPDVPIIVESLSPFASGLLAGTFVRGGLGLRAAVAGLPTGEHIVMRQALIRGLRRVMLPVMVSAFGLAGLSAIGSRRSNGQILRWLGLTFAGLPLLITRLGNVPLNQRMLVWSPQEPPSDLAGMVSRWETFDALRSVAAIAAFACQIGAAAAVRHVVEDRELRADGVRAALSDADRT